MRLVNFILYFLIVALMFWAGRAIGQTQGNLCYVRQSTASGVDLQSCGALTFPSPLASNSIVVAMIGWTGPDTGPLTTTVQGTLQSYTNTPTQCSGFDVITNHQLCIQFAYNLASSAGSESLSNSNSVQNTSQCSMDAVEVVCPVTHTFDVASTAAFPGTANQFTQSTTLTTAKNGDLVFTGTVGTSGFATIEAALGPAELGAADASSSGLLSMTIAGAHGSTTTQHSIYQIGPFLAQQAIAFQPSTNSIGTSVLPDGGVGTAYSATLRDVGGTVAPTWTVTVGSLPTGLSLNSSTGVISGTPSGSPGTSSFTVSDGTATAALSIKIGASLVTPMIKSYVAQTGEVYSLSGVAQGDALAVLAFGYDSSGDNGYIERDPTDTCGTVFHRTGPIFGGRPGGMLMWCGTPTTSCGADSISVHNTGNGSLLGGIALDISGGQCTIDWGSGNVIADATSSTFSLSSTITTAVANELLLSIGSAHVTTTNTLSLSSPWSVLGDAYFALVGWDSIFGSQQATTAGSYSQTFSGSSSPTANGGNRVEPMAIFGIRPAIPTTATFLGEKRHRRIW